MASSMMVSSATVTVARSTAPAQSTMVAPYTGLKSGAVLPAARRAATNLNHLPSNGGRVQCMKVWPIEGVKKFETLSYLPPLSPEALLKQIDYLLRSRWVPCLEFLYHSSQDRMAISLFTHVGLITKLPQADFHSNAGKLGRGFDFQRGVEPDEAMKIRQKELQDKITVTKHRHQRQDSPGESRSVGTHEQMIKSAN